MKTTAFLAVTLLLSNWFLFSSCSSEKNSKITVATPVPTLSPITNENSNIQEEIVKPEPSLYDEAFNEATKFVEAHSVRCGEIYYLLSDDYLWACKYPFEVEVDGKQFFPKEISEADKLNEVDSLPIEWSGNFEIKMRLCRTMSLGPASNKTWSEWRDTDSHKPKQISKAKGNWTIDNVSSFVNGGKIMKLKLTQCRSGSTIDIPNAFK